MYGISWGHITKTSNALNVIDIHAGLKTPSNHTYALCVYASCSASTRHDPADLLDAATPHDSPSDGPWFGHNERAREALLMHGNNEPVPAHFWPSPMDYEHSVGNPFVLPIAQLLYGTGRAEAPRPEVAPDCRVPIVAMGALVSLEVFQEREIGAHPWSTLGGWFWSSEFSRKALIET